MRTRMSEMNRALPGKRSMRAWMRVLRDGEVDFTRFARETREDWERLARYLMRRWDLPDGVEQEDVVQELLLAAHRFVWQWDPGVGSTLHGYVVWNAVDKAKKWMHRQRAAHRRDGKSHSRHALSFARLGLEEWQEEHLAVHPPEEHFEDRDARRELVARLVPIAASIELDPVERAILALLVEEGDEHAVASRVWQEPALCRSLRLCSPADARSATRKVIRRVRDAATASSRDVQ